MSQNHKVTVTQAFFVTLLWSSSWVIIKIGLKDISPLIFASMRYLLASVILLTVMVSEKTNLDELRNLSKKDFILLFLYGIFFTSLTQGLQFYALDFLPAITISFVLTFTIFFVIIFSTFLLKEIPTLFQLILLIIALIAGVAYFYPFRTYGVGVKGGLVLISILVANTIATIFGRFVNRDLNQNALVITTISMLFGSMLLFLYAINVENLPPFSKKVILIIVWLAVINTAFAFTLWNHTMQYLKAYESTIINNTMLPQITILALVFLDERPSLTQWISILVLIIVAIGVQLFNHQDREEKLLIN